MNTFQIIFLIVAASIILAIIIVNVYLYKKGRFAKNDIRPTIGEELEEIGGVDEYMKEIPVASPKPEKELVEPVVEDRRVHQEIDWAGLREWYYKAARNHTKSLKSASNNIRVFFIIQGCLILFLFFLLMGAPDGTPLLVVFSAIPYALLLGYYLNLTSKKVEEVITSTRYVELREDQFTKIWTSCYGLMDKMGLAYKLKIYYVKIDSFEASVVLEDRVVYLFLSRNLISYSHNHYEEVEAIIGHEFGHVYQYDTRMMLIARKSVQVPAIIGTVSTAITGAILIGALLAGGKGVEQVSGSVVLVANYWQLVFLRRSAEHLSDMASLIFTEKTTIRSLIDKYMPEKGSMQYPSKKDRLLFIDTVLNKYSGRQAQA